MTEENRSTKIASYIRNAIVEGYLIYDERLPSEAELATQFDCSRSTVREALKRLAAQSLIHTQRGATGGAFVKRRSYQEAYGDHVTTSTLLLSMNDIGFDVACEARFTLERACTPLACARAQNEDLKAMRAELRRQKSTTLSDEGFCASDVAFHRALVDSAGNPVLSYQLAGAVEAMQPLMNMITFTARSREHIVSLHMRLFNAIQSNEPENADRVLMELADYTSELGHNVMAQRAAQRR